jgi:hypothetical protein
MRKSGGGSGIASQEGKKIPYWVIQHAYLFIPTPDPPPEKGSSSGPFRPPLSFSVSGIFPPIRNTTFDHHLASRRTKTKIESFPPSNPIFGSSRHLVPGKYKCKPLSSALVLVHLYSMIPSKLATNFEVHDLG